MKDRAFNPSDVVTANLRQVKNTGKQPLFAAALSEMSGSLGTSAEVADCFKAVRIGLEFYDIGCAHDLCSLAEDLEERKDDA